MERLIAYIDGFNLYFGLKSKGWERFYWLDVQKLVQSLLKSHQQLVEVKYFTSLVSASPSDPDKPKRQNSYLEALQTLPDLCIFYGHYLQRPVTCKACGSTWPVYSEKMTDVNIATELLTDAFQDRFDAALLISGDSDLKMPLTKVKSLFPGKRVVVAFPPNRYSDVLARSASAIREAFAQACQAPPPACAVQKYGHSSLRTKLAALCRQLQRILGDEPFFLSGEWAGRLLEVAPVQGWRWLERLQADKIIRLVRKGGRGTGASEYRYIGDQAMP